MSEKENEQHFDVINGLHVRHMNNVVEEIFQYLDAESLQNAELTCKAWKAAASGVNQEKLWRVLLQNKMLTSPLWERLDHCLPSKLTQPSSNSLSSRNLFNKFEFTVKALQKNWLENELNRDYVDCDVGLRICVFQMRNKFIALWEPINGIFKIWNRITLKLEEVYQGPPLQFDLDYELYEHALLYSSNGLIYIRNLTTKTTKIYKPFGSDNGKSIIYLRVENGFLCAVVHQKQTFHMNYRSDVVVWKMKSPTEIEWENPRTVSSVRMDNTRILMDNKFIVVAHQGPFDTTCDVYLMSKPQRKPNYIKLLVTHRELLFQDGFILVITDKGEIKIVDVATSNSRIIATVGVNFSGRSNFLRIHSGYIFAFSFVGCSHGSRIQIWDFKKATDPTTELPLLPFCSHKLFMEPAMVLHVDTFGVMGVNREMGNVNCRDIIWTLNFLPICNFCKKVKKRLPKCASCKSAKYCSSICQKADWNHHRDLCRKTRDYEEKNAPFTLA
ncbi:F-box and WD repeat domain-containing 11-B-like isoform X1 [Daphnia pulicaria]|uniref:F-box and WD repeat domain-containing 11-B-like isoform X1 n=1 Tax=Daphnia pulicaria TaxID=35523 RepID=UPI001EEB95B8|nr:F-box and WD repeat domain-containing 11-B-like isoform X1 [Daphnia pulicaria]XP_046633672.1 F-box and WD repeat domain-containing 11-B-like isoform X1 [Daphnia pulicaria]XP_046633673.1 F-box and WD repeat domain-containing 11-B-like isoform X1 [Daphnia pulicaria]